MCFPTIESESQYSKKMLVILRSSFTVVLIGLCVLQNFSFFLDNYDLKHQ